MSIVILQAVVSGLVSGCVYALVSLSLVIIYKSVDLLNFGGGELVMVGAYLGLLLAVYFEFNYLIIFLFVIVVSFMIGAAFDRIVLRRIRGRGYARQALIVPMIVATLGLSYLLKGAVRVVPYTQEPRRLEPLLRGKPIFIGDAVLQWQDVGIVVVTSLIMLGLWLFFRYTMIGKGLQASSENPRAAALIGMPVTSFRMGAWGLAAAISGIAGILLAPKLLMTPDMGSVVMLAFAAAIVGGFTSLPGCVVGGIIIGVVQNLVGVLISPRAIAVTPFVIIMIVLMVRPQGLFGDHIATKKV